VCASTGYTWDEVGRLTIPRLKALMSYWHRHPPVHLLVAAYLGYKPEEQRGQTSGQAAEALASMAAMAPTISGAPKLDTTAWQNRPGRKD